MAELRFEVSGDSFVVSEVSEFAAARLGAKLLGHRPCGGEVSGEWDRGSLTPITTAGFEGKASLPRAAPTSLATRAPRARCV